MVMYRNGYVPRDVLVSFGSGTDTYGPWEWLLPPATYQRHLNLVSRALKRTGRVLKPTVGYSCYRPYAFQVIYKRVHGAGAATPGQSSHGGTFGNRDAMAIDYGNWSSVYGGNRANFFADARAEGFSPGVITQPDEPWHLIDYNPWSGSGAGGGGVTPVPPANPINLEDEMIRIQSTGRGIALIGPGYYRPLSNNEEVQQSDAIISKHVTGNDRQFDLWVSMALGGKTAASDADVLANSKLDTLIMKPASPITDAQIKAIADAVIAAIGKPEVTVDYDKIASDVRAKFTSSPLK